MKGKEKEGKDQDYRKILKRLQRGKMKKRIHGYEQEAAYMEEGVKNYFLESILAKSE